MSRAARDNLAVSMSLEFITQWVLCLVGSSGFTIPFLDSTTLTLVLDVCCVLDTLATTY